MRRPSQGRLRTYAGVGDEVVIARPRVLRSHVRQQRVSDFLGPLFRAVSGLIGQITRSKPIWLDQYHPSGRLRDASHPSHP